ncbi:hypothetical protein L3X38_041202 [Prunus dulcis]|uniref:DUF4283 domain-containing protein n=1 Tax=Prunus dulcis TaxID=3755 RepID=A0AAD4USM0_PRUDU|nr:hypothetical protein L3X38_041202 [Prunus dulcis]
MADQIINEGPWSIMGFCFNVQCWPSNMVIEELPLHKVAYWIQAHRIPLNLLTAGNTLEIREKLGEDSGCLELKDRVHGWKSNSSRCWISVSTVVSLDTPEELQFQYKPTRELRTYSLW